MVFHAFENFENYFMHDELPLTVNGFKTFAPALENFQLAPRSLENIRNFAPGRLKIITFLVEFG